MTSAELIAAVRRGIREPSPITVSDAQITTMVNRGATVIGMKIREGDPSYFSKRTSLSSSTNQFAWPTDCMSIQKVWDLEGNAEDVTGAADDGGGNIRLTVTATELVDDDIVLVHSITGTTEANGTWKIEDQAANSIDLKGSTFTNVYVSGGKVFKLPQNPPEIHAVDISQATGSNDRKWYPQGKYIIIDDVSFTYDIMVDYEYLPDESSEIPAEYHEGLVAFAVINLINIPDPQDPDYAVFKKYFDTYTSIWKLVNDQIEATFKPASEPRSIRDRWKTETDEDYQVFSY